jgi:hypothetical protein
MQFFADHATPQDNSTATQPHDNCTTTEPQQHSNATTAARPLQYQVQLGCEFGCGC